MLANFDMTFFNRLFGFLLNQEIHIKPYEQFFMEMENFLSESLF